MKCLESNNLYSQWARSSTVSYNRARACHTSKTRSEFESRRAHQIITITINTYIINLMECVLEDKFDPLGPARGLMIGIVVGSALWALIILAYVTIN